MPRANQNIPQKPTTCMISILIILGVFCIVPIGVYFVFFAKPQQLPIYEQSSVEKICLVFRIDPNDEFCANSTRQNARTFEAVLQRYYPIETTFHDDIMSLVEVRFTKPSNVLLDELGTSAIGFCPLPQERGEKEYSCAILFSPPVGPLTIYFDSPTEEVAKYIAWRPSGS